MTDGVTIERITLRGGPCDGQDRTEVGAAGLIATISVHAPAGTVVRYRKTDEYDQLRGINLVEPYARIWFYDWLPDPDAIPETH